MATAKTSAPRRSPSAKTATPSRADVPRKRGRPPKVAQVMEGATPLIGREQVIERAVQMAKVEPLAELSIIGLAREFGVTPALIHYYIGSRDDLISGVVNLYFKTRVERLGGLTGDWRSDVEHHARQSYALMIEYGGVLRYIMSHNRFRLFQQVAPGQTDYGLVYLNRMAQIFQDGGFSPEHSAMGYHLLAQYTMTAAYAEVSRQLPAAHAKFIVKRIQQAPEAEYGAAHFMAEPFSHVDAETAFEAGLELLLDGMAQWRASRPAKRVRKAAR